MMITFLDEKDGEIISGIFHSPISYFILTILMPAGAGSCVFEIDQIKEIANDLNWIKYPAGYSKTHGMSAVYDYTLYACLLAASILLENHDDLEKACEMMLRVPEIEF